jgi:hypothetical protein
MSAIKLTTICLCILPWMVAPAFANDEGQELPAPSITATTPLQAVPQEPVSSVPLSGDAAPSIPKGAFTPFPADFNSLLANLNRPKTQAPQITETTQESSSPPPVTAQVSPLVQQAPVVTPQYVIVQVSPQYVIAPPQIIVVQAAPSLSPQYVAPSTAVYQPVTPTTNSDSSETDSDLPSMADLSSLKALLPASSSNSQARFQRQPPTHGFLPMQQRHAAFYPQRASGYRPPLRYPTAYHSATAQNRWRGGYR